MAKPVMPLSNSLPRDLGQLFVEGQGAGGFIPSTNVPIFNWVT